jgi:hypothetical protein
MRLALHQQGDEHGAGARNLRNSQFATRNSPFSKEEKT